LIELEDAYGKLKGTERVQERKHAPTTEKVAP
jgi:hypothetical protein